MSARLLKECDMCKEITETGKCMGKNICRPCFHNHIDDKGVIGDLVRMVEGEGLAKENNTRYRNVHCKNVIYHKCDVCKKHTETAKFGLTNICIICFQSKSLDYFMGTNKDAYKKRFNINISYLSILSFLFVIFAYIIFFAN